MSAPPQAVAGLAWAIVGPPLLVFAALRVRRGRTSLHAGLMIARGDELAVFTASVHDDTGSAPPGFAGVAFFKIHLVRDRVCVSRGAITGRWPGTARITATRPVRRARCV